MRAVVLLCAGLMTTVSGDVLIDFGAPDQATALVADFENASGSIPFGEASGTVFTVSGPGASGGANSGYLLFNFFERGTATPVGTNAYNSNLTINDLENDYVYLTKDSNPAVTVEVANISSVLSPDTTYTLYLWGQGDQVDQGSAFVFDSSSIGDPAAGLEQKTADSPDFGDEAVSYTFTTPSELPASLKFDWYRANEGAESTSGYAGMPAMAITGETIEETFDPGVPTAFTVNGQSVVRTECDFPASAVQLQGYEATFDSLVAPVSISTSDPDLVYLSNDLDVCTVDAGGAVTPTGVGSTTVDVTYKGITESVPVDVALGFAPDAVAKHRYSFINGGVPSAGPEVGTAEPDLIGAADGVVWNASYDGAGKLVFDNGDGACPYVDLPNGIFTELRADNGSFTIEWFANTTRAGGGWQRFFSFGSSTSTGAAEGLEVGEHDETCPFPTGNGDHYFDIVSKENNASNMRVEVSDDGGRTPSIVGYAFPSNEEIHWVLSFDATCDSLNLYQDSKVVQSIVGINEKNLDSINDVNNWIGRAAWNGNATFAGTFTEVRMYSGVMNGLQVSQSFAAGADATELLPDPGDLETLNLTPDDLVVTAASSEEDRQLTALAGFSIAGDLDVTTVSGIAYTSGDEGVVTVNGAGLVTSVGPGTTTISATFTHPTGVASDTINVSVESVSSVAVESSTGSTTLFIDGMATPAIAFNALANFDTIQGLDVTDNEATTWSTDDEFGDVLTIDENGVVTPTFPGTAMVTATFDGTEGSIEVTVADVPVKTPVMNHHYTFNYTAGATSTNVPDSAGTTNGSIDGTGFSYDGSSLVLPGGEIVDGTTTAAHVNFPNGMVSGLDTSVHGNAHSFEMWVTRTSTNNWERLFSFGSSQSGEGLSGTGDTYLYLTAQNSGTSSASAAYTLDSNGAESLQLSDSAEFPTVETHIVLTYDADHGISKLYIDGFMAEETGFGYVAPENTLAMLNDVNNWLGRAQWGDPLPAIAINEFNIYSGIFSDEDVENQLDAGPDDTPLDTPVNLSLGIRSGPGANQVTLFWPSNSPEGTVLESSSTLQAPWTMVPGSDSPSEVGGNFEFSVTTGEGFEGFRLNDSP